MSKNVKLSALEFKTAYCRKFPKIIKAVEKAFSNEMFININGRLFDRQMLKFEYSEKEGNIKITTPYSGISGEKLSAFGKVLKNLFFESRNGKVIIIIRLNYDSNEW
jgi:hypothetical protein